jgi:hypothetical protein
MISSELRTRLEGDAEILEARYAALAREVAAGAWLEKLARQRELIAALRAHDGAICDAVARAEKMRGGERVAGRVVEARLTLQLALEARIRPGVDTPLPPLLAQLEVILDRSGPPTLSRATGVLAALRQFVRGFSGAGDDEPPVDSTHEFWKESAEGRIAARPDFGRPSTQERDAALTGARPAALYRFLAPFLEKPVMPGTCARRE